MVISCSSGNRICLLVVAAVFVVVVAVVVELVVVVVASSPLVHQNTFVRCAHWLVVVASSPLVHQNTFVRCAHWLFDEGFVTFQAVVRCEISAIVAKRFLHAHDSGREIHRTTTGAQVVRFHFRLERSWYLQ